MDSHRAVVSVLGVDRIGIIARVANVLADAQVNIVDISQTVMDDFFSMILIADLGPMSLSFEELRARLVATGEALQLRIDIQHDSAFRFMHRI